MGDLITDGHESDVLSEEAMAQINRCVRRLKGERMATWQHDIVTAISLFIVTPFAFGLAALFGLRTFQWVRDGFRGDP